MKHFAVLTFSCLVGIGASAGLAPAEVRPAPSAPCYPGAYYRKAVSSLDHWTGIEGVIKLPEPDYDITRAKPDGRPLDNASIYLGGNSDGQEIDCGVTWEVIREADGSVSKTGKAFRPFWRNESWANAPARPEYYFYPGDIIRMKVDNNADGKLVMRIDLLARAGTPEADRRPSDSVSETTPIVAARRMEPGAALTTTPVDAISSFTTVFEARKFQRGSLKQFKRVNGLDQSGNEGKPVQPTNTRITNAQWQEVWLLKGTERLPMTPERFTDMRCPDAKHIAVSRVGVSGETVNLIGNPEAK